MEMRSELRRKLAAINDEDARLVLSVRVMLEDKAESYLLHVDAESFVNDYDCELFDMVHDNLTSLGETFEEEFVFEFFEFDNKEVEKFCSTCVAGPHDFNNLREVVEAMQDYSLEIIEAGLAIDVWPSQLDDAYYQEISSPREFNEMLLEYFQDCLCIEDYIMQFIDEEKVISSLSDEFTESNGYVFRDNY